MADLSSISGPDTIEILPGLVFEDRIRIRTQRKLEKHFKVSMFKMFPGKGVNPLTNVVEAWPGIDFTFLDHLIPLLTILGQQVNERLEESTVENLLDDLKDPGLLAERITQYFDAVKARGEELDSGKNLKKPNL